MWGPFPYVIYKVRGWSEYSKPFEYNIFFGNPVEGSGSDLDGERREPSLSWD